jgi:hypothetical protein
VLNKLFKYCFSCWKTKIIKFKRINKIFCWAQTFCLNSKNRIWIKSSWKKSSYFGGTFDCFR